MASVGTYLNFPGNTEEAFEYYRSIFGGEFEGGVMRMGDGPPQEGQPPMPDDVANLVMHVALPILGGHLLMGTDAPESLGFTLTTGNNVHISLSPESRAETDRIFTALADGGEVTMPLQDMFWGAYFGSCIDRFGICWMVNHHPAPS